MLFNPKLKSARLIKRYKRFLAYVQLEDQREIIIHCANTGAMTGCATPNDIVWYSTSSNLKRKYIQSWELTQTHLGHWICVNTILANKLVIEAVKKNSIKELSGYKQVYTEVLYGQENSRIDLLLKATNKPNCYIEVKSVTLLEQGYGYFPDTVTLRGQKHLRELTRTIHQGYRAVLFFVILHTGIDKMTPAKHIDYQYVKLLKKARMSGVEIICYSSYINAERIELSIKKPFL